MDNGHSGQPINILLVEDNPGDVRLTREVLKEAKIASRLVVVHDGVEAVEYLNRQGAFADAIRPDIVLLDLNLPRKDGREVLGEIKNNDSLKSIPVVVMTASRSDEDVISSYNLHANCYITKPVDLTQFMKVVRAVQEFWLTMVRLPSIGG